MQDSPRHRSVGIVHASWNSRRDWLECGTYRHLRAVTLCFLVSQTHAAEPRSRTKLGESLKYRAQTGRKPGEFRIRHGRGRATTGRIVFLMLFLPLAVCLFAIASWGKQVNAITVKVEGTVFVKDSAGNQSVVAGATVEMSGPDTFETESDENGKYVIAAVPLGSYTVEAVSPGLKAVQTVHVEAREVRVSLELRPLLNHPPGWWWRPPASTRTHT